MTKLFSNYKRAAIDLLRPRVLPDRYDWQDLLGFFIWYWGNQSWLSSPCQSGSLTEQVGKILHQPNLYHNQLQEDAAGPFNW